MEWILNKIEYKEDILKIFISEGTFDEDIDDLKEYCVIFDTPFLWSTLLEGYDVQEEVLYNIENVPSFIKIVKASDYLEFIMNSHSIISDINKEELKLFRIISDNLSLWIYDYTFPDISVI